MLVGFATDTLGRFDTTGVGLLMTPVGCCNEAIVATDEFELVRVGVGGRKEGIGLGDGIMLADDTCLSKDGTAGAVGVCIGVTSVVPEVEMFVGTLADRLRVWPLYTVPSSPGANANVEQKPSDEHMMRVDPSLDLLQVSLQV